jgi:hypothetical protein
MNSSSNPGKTPFLNFFAFLFAFGWEGPLVFSIGMDHHSTLEISIGLVFTLVFWGLFGFRLLFELVKHILKATKDAFAAKPSAKSDL